MPIRGHFPPNAGAYGKNAVVDALFMFIDEDESFAGARWRDLTPTESQRPWEVREISRRPIPALRVTVHFAWGIGTRGVAPGPPQTLASCNCGFIGGTNVEGGRSRIGKEKAHLNIGRGRILLSVAEHPRAFHVPRVDGFVERQFVVVVVRVH